ncbi:MAG: ATP synthase F1 subunit delta [Planctomycetota bacterium]|nr:ATP synthase F1 subunit delta [Planctomycetota bacterium]
MKSKALRVRYAKALLSLIESDGELRNVHEQLKSIASVLSNPDLSNFLLNPAVASHIKEKLIHSALKDVSLNPKVVDFLRLLAIKRRLNLLTDIAEEFERLMRERLNEQEVLVKSAYPLTQEEKERISAFLRRRYGKQEIILKETVDKELIGGIWIKIGDKVLDGSLNMRLRALKENLIKSD